MFHHYAKSLVGCTLVALVGTGCAASHATTRSQAASIPWTTPLLERASFALDCPTHALVIEKVTTWPGFVQATSDVRGCGKHATFASVNGAWFIAHDDAPRAALATAPRFAIAPVVVAPESELEPAPEHVRHARRHHR